MKEYFYNITAKGLNCDVTSFGTIEISEVFSGGELFNALVAAMEKEHPEADEIVVNSMSLI